MTYRFITHHYRTIYQRRSIALYCHRERHSPAVKARKSRYRGEFVPLITMFGRAGATLLLLLPVDASSSDDRVSILYGQGKIPRVSNFAPRSLISRGAFALHRFQNKSSDAPERTRQPRYC